MQVNVGCSDDYATLKSGRYEFYYGYEVTLNGKVDDDDNDNEWCFQVKENGNVIMKLPTSEIIKQIDDKNLDYPRDFLIAGIGIWLLLKKK
jgi:hypothetical protein